MPVRQHPYRLLTGEKTAHPLCDLFLLGPGTPGRAPLQALVDSGAAFSVFPTSAADSVDLSLPPANFPIQFGSGRSFGSRARAYIELDGERWSTEVVFVERLPFRYALLGRFGVFARFSRVSFLERLPTPLTEFQR